MNEDQSGNISKADLVAQIREARKSPAIEALGNGGTIVALVPEWLDALCAEVEYLRTDQEEADALRSRLAELLSQAAIALNGPEPPLTRWSWHDIPEKITQLQAEVERLQALIRHYEAAENFQQVMTSVPLTEAEKLPDPDYGLDGTQPPAPPQEQP